MLAAIYLHGDGLYGKFHRFFAHLPRKLGSDIGGTLLPIVIGSVEEAALRKAFLCEFSVQDICKKTSDITYLTRLEKTTR